VTPVQSISETDIMPGSYAITSYANILCQLMPTVRDKFHLHDFSHIGEELLDMEKKPLCALSKLLPKPADIPEYIEDLPNVLTLANK
jgi:hypothetical protein